MARSNFVFGQQVIVVEYDVKRDEAGKPVDVTITQATKNGRPTEIQGWWHQPLMMGEVADWKPSRN